MQHLFFFFSSVSFPNFTLINVRFDTRSIHWTLTCTKTLDPYLLGRLYWYGPRFKMICGSTCSTFSFFSSVSISLCLRFLVGGSGNVILLAKNTYCFYYLYFVQVFIIEKNNSCVFIDNVKKSLKTYISIYFTILLFIINFSTSQI